MESIDDVGKGRLLTIMLLLIASMNLVINLMRSPCNGAGRKA